MSENVRPVEQKNPAVKTMCASERFTARVMKEFGGTVGAPQVTDYQRQLIQGYFIAIDRALKMAEDERQRKNKSNSDHKYDNDLQVTWDNVNLNDLALDIVHYARMGLDMMQENHLFPIPYKNNKARKYDVNLMPGYNGIRYIAEKYAVAPPKNVIVELVYDSDTFRPIKKDSKHHIESYEFSINNPFDRGKIIGGFGYIEYGDPEKNELVMMSMHDIEKRKPKYASANFWGGEATEWVDGKRQKVKKEGWLEEMCLKTIKREVYGAKHIPRDPKKIDDNYQYMKMRESRMAEARVENEIHENANRTYIDVDVSPEKASLPKPAQRRSVKVDTETGEVKEPAEGSTAPAQAQKQRTAAQPAKQEKGNGQQAFDVGF